MLAWCIAQDEYLPSNILKQTDVDTVWEIIADENKHCTVSILSVHIEEDNVALPKGDITGRSGVSEQDITNYMCTTSNEITLC